MRSCIKYAAFVISAAVMSSAVYADLDIHCDYDKEVVSVAGETRYDGDYYNLSVSPVENEPIILISGKTDSSKKYELKFDFSEYDTGNYILKTGTRYGGEEEHFSFVKIEDAKKLAGLINSAASESDIEKLFESAVNKVIFDADAYDYTALDNKSRLYRMILAERPIDAGAGANEIAKELSRIGYIWAFGECGSSGDALVFAKENADSMGISDLKSFCTVDKSYIADGFKEKWYDEARKMREDTAEKFLAEYDRRYALLALKNLKKSEYAAELLKDIGADIDYTGFNKLSPSDKTAVGTFVTFSSNFKSVEEAAAAFNEKVAQYTKKTDKPSAVGGGGGGGGSSSGGSSSNLAVISGESNRNTSSETEFADMAGFEWANDAVKQLKAWGVIDGVGDNNYAPARNVTREEFTKLIVSAFDIDGNGAEPSYSDVDKNAWYYSSIKAAYSNKIVNGISNELFGIGEYISRQDAACILFRMLNSKGIEQTVGECGFSDSSDIAGYAYDAVSALWKSGLISGKGNGDFCPDDNLNRAEAAKLIYNICVYIGR